MLIQPYDIFVYAWLAVAVLSAAYVAWDQSTGNPEPAVMEWGFVLVTLYMGPIGLLLSPMIAALAMSLSSVSVVTNALRLSKAHLPQSSDARRLGPAHGTF